MMLEVGLLDDWVVIASTETGGPSITVDECSWRRIVAAAESLLASR
ncbi:hypothetical protein [Leifsonia sp. LS1]|nr:hypothetical protein [Leifsonia sp. LS1]